MIKSKHQQNQSDRKPVSYCFNRDCQQPKNFHDSNTCISCSSSLLLKNRYRAAKLIGHGGFGRTFQGIDESQESKPYCAIKQFWVQSGSPSIEKATELFSQEAQRLEVLGTFPNIPALQDYFVEAEDRYLIQEFINGRNLSEELAEEGAWSEAKVRNLLLNLLPLMQFFHSQQIIHRDIKPENIIRRQHDRELFLVDFGAAKVVTETNLDKTGTVIGSAAYTAPEQLQGKAVFASDFYSLGVTCIHLLTQVHPFNLFDSGEYVWKWGDYLSQPVSDRLKRIIDKMLEGAVNKRYQSAEEILKDLREKPVKPKNTAKKLLGASAAAVLVLLGMRALMSPVIRQVSTTIEQEPSRQYSSLPQMNSEVGGLYGYSEGKQVRAFPLEHTAVTAKIAGNLSRVEVKQTFSNPNDTPLEAIYKFPLPEDAAVDDMEIRIGDRVIRGIIKKREEAKKIYQEAKREGKTAGLLEQQRDNIFTQSLANIQPGEKIDVVIRYTNSLEFIGSNYEFVFPMVVAPRYGSETPTGKGFNLFEAPAWASNLPETRSGNDIDVNIEIDAGVDISELQSFSHPIEIQKNRSITRVSLAKRDTIANQDLILRYQVTGAKTQATVLTQRSQQGGHFATYLIPAVNYKPEQIVPKDVIFLIDTSGSQSGAAIEQSKELMRQFISGLNEQDTFNIIDFANSTSKLADEPLANTRENRSQALAYVSKLEANGGTELMNGINTVLNFPAATDGRLRSIVLLSDGLIGGDEEVIGKIREKLEPGNRLYSFGVGHSTNRFLLNRLAELGRGTVTILPPKEDAVEVADKFFREINKPVVTNIEVKWMGEGEAPEIYPQQSPDLFASQPLILYGRKQDSQNGKLKIIGTLAGGQSYEKVLNVNFEQVSGNGAIAQLWGRSRIKDLMNQMYGRENPEGVSAVTETALDYNLLSKYTAFVAVDDSKENKNLLSQRQRRNNVSAPEPSDIIGNLLALIFILLFFTRKRWNHLAKSMLHKLGVTKM